MYWRRVYSRSVLHRCTPINPKLTTKMICFWIHPAKHISTFCSTIDSSNIFLLIFLLLPYLGALLCWRGERHQFCRRLYGCTNFLAAFFVLIHPEAPNNVWCTFWIPLSGMGSTRRLCNGWRENAADPAKQRSKCRSRGTKEPCSYFESGPCCCVTTVP